MLDEGSVQLLAALLLGYVAAWWFYLFYRAASSSAPVPGPVPEPASGPPSGGSPKVSIIVPALNEEDYVGGCLGSFVRTDYPNYEIIAVDDMSDDATYDIMRAFGNRYPNVSVLRAGHRPPGWIGKTWACKKGREAATGTLLLFTDADSTHESDTLSRAVSHLGNGDVLTLSPSLEMPGFWTKAATPAITAFKIVHPEGVVIHTAREANDPANKTGGLLGGYILARAGAYDAVMGHEGVHDQILEDWALGRNLRQAGFSVRLADGSTLVRAHWARNLHTLWHVFTRLVAPVAASSPTRVAGMFSWLVLLMVVPYAALPASLLLGWPVLAVTSAAAVAGNTASYWLQARNLGIPVRYRWAAPFGGMMAAAGFCAGLLGRTTWRGRTYKRDELGGGDP